MYAVLMATVLAGGLAAGDGGGTAPVDPGRVCVDFGGEWVGKVEENLNRGPTGVHFLGNGLVRLHSGAISITVAYHIVPDGVGKIRVDFSGDSRVYFGIYKLQGRNLYICVSDRPG